MTSGKERNYTELKDASLFVNQRVNLLGIISEAGVRKKSKGTDYYCTLKIIDTLSQDLGVSLTIFADKKESLPSENSAGDIICLHRVLEKLLQMTSHGSDIHASAMKKSSSYALFHGTSGEEIIPYLNSSNIQITDFDKTLIMRLRTWLVDNQIDSGINELVALLKDIKPDQVFDLVCKVVYTQELSEDQQVLFVWDGTDTPSVSLDENQNELPLQLEPLPLPRDVLCIFPSLGTVLRVFVDKGLGLQGGGQWLKLRNITYKVSFGLWQGVLSPPGQIRFLSNEDKAVISRSRCYFERLSGLDCMPLSSFPLHSQMTETAYEEIGFSTLMNVLTHPQVTWKFKCVVRVVSIYPCKAENFISKSLNVYRIRLTLEDPTARIRAFLYGEDGVNFFQGYQPEEVLTSRMNKLLGVSESTGEGSSNVKRNPPWVQLCVKSYYIEKDDVWGSRQYQIFGTKLVA